MNYLKYFLLVMKKRAVRRIRPFLWYLSNDPKNSCYWKMYFCPLSLTFVSDILYQEVVFILKFGLPFRSSFLWCWKWSKWGEFCEKDPSKEIQGRSGSAERPSASPTATMRQWIRVSLVVLFLRTQVYASPLDLPTPDHFSLEHCVTAGFFLSPDHFKKHRCVKRKRTMIAMHDI